MISYILSSLSYSYIPRLGLHRQLWISGTFETLRSRSDFNPEETLGGQLAPVERFSSRAIDLMTSSMPVLVQLEIAPEIK